MTDRPRLDWRSRARATSRRMTTLGNPSFALSTWRVRIGTVLTACDTLVNHLSAEKALSEAVPREHLGKARSSKCFSANESDGGSGLPAKGNHRRSARAWEPCPGESTNWVDRNLRKPTSPGGITSFKVTRIAVNRPKRSRKQPRRVALQASCQGCARARPQYEYPEDPERGNAGHTQLADKPRNQEEPADISGQSRHGLESRIGDLLPIRRPITFA